MDSTWFLTNGLHLFGSPLIHPSATSKSDHRAANNELNSSSLGNVTFFFGSGTTLVLLVRKWMSGVCDGADICYPCDSNETESNQNG
ncbi:hypothetical protein OUZ56_026147 [Daphnia magna]|uniref:Uncharacterized protein n=1 Tax=Daphnia magna TaxID=35525 RepID=A0ABQ9ZKX0_9CRUS|nr:hypothetical protein OUZ56_026147 [Daphnia magna]